ncbi:MAG: hypothetical protein V8Q36_08015 [Anaerotignum sp.]
MAREKFQTLTEQMFYILLCLQEECYGMDIMEKVAAMTEGRVTIGPGTLYNLLEQFQKRHHCRNSGGGAETLLPDHPNGTGYAGKGISTSDAADGGLPPL